LNVRALLRSELKNFKARIISYHVYHRLTEPCSLTAAVTPRTGKTMKKCPSVFYKINFEVVGMTI